MEISRLLSVDGYIKANSYDTTSTVYNGASGGSGGSIIINTGNFTGNFFFHFNYRKKKFTKLADFKLPSNLSIIPMRSSLLSSTQ